MPELKLENSLVDGRYEVYERLSRGSYAEIFVAYDRAVSRAPVVIKALNTSLQGTPDADLERTLVENFQNEAVALDAVRHQHVILRLGHGTAADLRGVPFHYLVLEYMPGGDLLELCRHRPDRALPLDEALFYFHQVCEALAYAHSKGIIHRDLKPNNFLLSADKRVLKVADFGVAKITTGEVSEITRVGADVYAPPEHNPNENTGELQHLTTAADVYSLAKSFYTVICGRAPSQYRCDPILALPDNFMTKPWAGALVNVLRHATNDDPKMRYATVAEFWHELAQVAVLAPTIKLEELPDEETIVKPRLSVAGSALPKTPVQPDFDPTPATSQLGVMVAPATPVVAPATPVVVPATPVETEPLTLPLQTERLGVPTQTEIRVDTPTEPFPEVQPETGSKAQDKIEPATPLRRGERQSKIFIELQPQKAAPVTPAQPAQPPAGQSAQAKPASQVRGRQPAKTRPRMADKFSEKLRRRVFILFMCAAFVGLLVSVYNFFRGGEFGTPGEIEVVTTALYVRSGPSVNFKPYGTIAGGTKHRVIQQNDQGWLQIEVDPWMQLEPDAPPEVRQGWVNGKSGFIRVVSRRWW